MTPEEAKIILLENALIEAHHTISFLHGCLTQPSEPIPAKPPYKAGEHGFRGYSYEYPEQTLRELDRIAALVEIPVGCHHSYYAPDRGIACNNCVDSRDRHRKLVEAKGVLSIE